MISFFHSISGCSPSSASRLQTSCIFSRCHLIWKLIFSHMRLKSFWRASKPEKKKKTNKQVENVKMMQRKTQTEPSCCFRQRQCSNLHICDHSYTCLGSGFAANYEMIFPEQSPLCVLRRESMSQSFKLFFLSIQRSLNFRFFLCLILRSKREKRSQGCWSDKVLL